MLLYTDTHMHTKSIPDRWRTWCINTTLKFLTENISKQLLDFGIEDLLNTADKPLTITENIDNFHFVNIKKFYSLKDKLNPDHCVSVGWASSRKAKDLLVPLPVRAHAWVAGRVPGWGMYERQLMDVSLSHWCFSPSLSSLPLSLIINQ